MLHIVRKVTAAAVLIAFAGCGGSKPQPLPPGASEGDPPRVVAEYARIAKIPDCAAVRRERAAQQARMDELDKQTDRTNQSALTAAVGEMIERKKWSDALAKRAYKLDCPLGG